MIVKGIIQGVLQGFIERDARSMNYSSFVLFFWLRAYFLKAYNGLVGKKGI